MSRAEAAKRRVTVERMLCALKAGSDLRRSKVRRLRTAILAQEYENPLKLQVAMERLAQDLRDVPGPGSAKKPRARRGERQ